MAKRGLCILLAVLTLFALTVPAFAEEAQDDGAVSDASEVQVAGTNSVGDLIAGEMNTQTNTKNTPGDGITDLQISGNTATVEFSTRSSADVVVAIYDETSGQMVASGKRRAWEGDTIATVNIVGEVPTTFIASVFLLDVESHEPLCDDYTTNLYTSDMAAFLNTDINDYDPDLVLNLDSDPTTNFMVYDEETVLIEPAGATNALMDNGNGTYTVTGADNSFTSLQPGDVFTYEYADGTVLPVKVASVSVSGTTVTVTEDPNITLDDVFDVVRIDIEGEETGEGLSTAALNFSGKASTEFSIELSLGEHGSIFGSAGVSFNLKLYKTWTQKYVEFTTDYSLTGRFKLKGEGEKKVYPLADVFTFHPLPAITIKITPAIVLQPKGSIEFSATLKGTVGMAIDGNRKIDKSKPAKFEPSLKMQGTLFVGFSLEPQVVVLHEKIAKVSLTAEVGFEIKAAYELRDDPSIQHDCQECLDGDVDFKAKVSAAIKVAGCWKLEWKFFELSIKLMDFYFCAEHGGFGIGTCPYIRYRVRITVKDQRGAPVPGALIKNTGSLTIPVTDNSGVATFYLSNGSYRLTVTDQHNTDSRSLSLEVKNRGQQADVELDLSAPVAAAGTLSGVICEASDRRTPVSGADIFVYGGSELAAQLQADANGNYSVSLPAGRYRIDVTSPGYVRFTGYVTVSGTGNTYMETILLVEGTEGDIGVADGTVTDALTGSGLVGVTLSVRRGWNNPDTGEVLQTFATDQYGDYTVTLPYGNYTLSMEKAGYVSSSFNIVVQSGTTDNQDGVMNPENDSQALRIVLTWGRYPEDLDSHLVCPADSEYHVYFMNEDFAPNGHVIANLDVDCTESYGPETTTIYRIDPTANYSFYVHNYTDRRSSTSDSLSRSGAVVTVSLGNELIATYNVPTNCAGTLWHVFDFDAKTNTITRVDEFACQSDPDFVGYPDGINTASVDALKDYEKDGVTTETGAAEPTAEPEVTMEPEVTAEPEVTMEPEVTAEPEVTVETELPVDTGFAPTDASQEQSQSDIGLAAAFTGTSDNQTALFTGLKPSADYAVLVMVDASAADLLAASNLLFIAQVAADSNGNIALAYVPRTDSAAQVRAYGPEPEPVVMPEPTATPVPQLAAPTVTIAQVSDGIKVTWNAIEGSPRYMVYYKENDGGWKKIGTTTSTSYTRAAKYLKNGVTYQFTVRCCENDKKTLLGPYEASNGLKYYAVPTVKIARVSGGIKVSWNKIDSVPRYMVYYKENGGSWKKIGTTTSTTYTRKAANLKSGATYQFTVRCCANDKKTLLGPYKASNSLTYTAQLAAPTVKIAKVSGGIKVTWNKVSGSPRYMVYYKEGNGGWKKIGTTTSTTYTRAAKYLKNGVTYQFTVRCCANDKKTMLSTYKASNSLNYKQ